MSPYPLPLMGTHKLSVKAHTGGTGAQRSTIGALSRSNHVAWRTEKHLRETKFDISYVIVLEN